MTQKHDENVLILHFEAIIIFLLLFSLWLFSLWAYPVNDLWTLYVGLLFCNTSKRPPATQLSEKTTFKKPKQFSDRNKKEKKERAQIGMKGMHVHVISFDIKSFITRHSSTLSHTHADTRWGEEEPIK